jgi:hypothetical protein
MSADEELALTDRLAITDLMHRFYRLVDQGRAGETAVMFTETARLTVGPGAPKPGTTEGPAIAALMAARGRQVDVTTRHVLSNIVLSRRPDGMVAGYSLLTLFRSETDSRDSQPASVADVDEVFVRDIGGWRIQERTISPIFSRG